MPTGDWRSFRVRFLLHLMKVEVFGFPAGGMAARLRPETYRKWPTDTISRGACGLVWINTGKRTRSRGGQDRQIDKSFLILWVVVHCRSELVKLNHQLYMPTIENWLNHKLYMPTKDWSSLSVRLFWHLYETRSWEPWECLTLLLGIYASKGPITCL